VSLFKGLGRPLSPILILLKPQDPKERGREKERERENDNYGFLKGFGPLPSKDVNLTPKT
jgi:hypothetical protein